jgi:DNA-binding MarR family transcriptional regulator/GNAT superfamily N-acetyltransferase
MAVEQVDQFRRFNRTVTQRVGALSDRFLARDRPLGEARVLWEIGAEGCEVRALRSRLELDSGQASRVLRSLEAAGMIRVVPSTTDRRVRIAELTPEGVAERAELDRRSEELAASILEALDDDKRQRLVEAMQTVERLLTSASVEIHRADPAGPDARQCLRAYFEELNRRSATPYDPALGVSAFPHEMRPPAGDFLLAHLHGEPVGCGGVKHRPGEPSEIKRMWVSPAARGLGIGRRLLGELERIVQHSGARIARLETSGLLTEAISLYRAAGYREVEPFNREPFADHWFEKRL